MASDLVKDLQDLLAIERDGDVCLDLKEVTVVARDAVRFLANAEAAGIRIVNCPDYVRRWIGSEKSRKQDRLHSRADEEGKEG